MIGLVLSLSLVVASVHLPIHKAPLRVGWRVDPSVDPLAIETVQRREQPAGGGASAPITRFDVPADDAAGNDEAGDAGPDEAGDAGPDGPEPEPESVRALDDLTRMEMSVLEFAEQQPRVEGGLGAYYLNIHYPEAAQRAGIEGRLVLEFIVEPDGTPSHIRVLQPLHALLDSAAVQALRRTTFIPGRQNGQTVRVRMRLPVRFELIDIDPVPADTTRQDSTVLPPGGQGGVG